MDLLRLVVRGSGGTAAGAPRGTRLRRAARRGRRLTAAVLGPVVAAGTSLVPAAAVTGAVTAGLAAAAVVKAAPAKASSLGSVLILSSSVNGGTSSAEAAAATADGYSPVLESSSSWDALTGSSSEFSGYAAVIIGDPSTGGTCSATPDTDATGNEADWGPEITGNVAVLGTAPALAGSAGTALMQDAIAYAASGPSGTTGLYISLNCDYASSSESDADASLLNDVYGGGFDVTGHVTGSGPACTDSGTVNTLEADTSGSFASMPGSALSASSWGSTACPVQETFNTWPANFTPVGYDASATPADFTASSGTSGQPYVLLGTPTPTAATKAATPTTGGEVPQAAEVGGSNAASHAVQAIAASAAPVNTENGDFTQTGTDLSVLGFGPSLAFTRSYDSQTAQAQEQTATPGPLGYGWTDNWASKATANVPVPGDIYALDGLAGAASTGDGLTAYAAGAQAPASSPLGYPGGVLYNGGNIYFSDTGGNRVEEIPGASGTQWGISMTAGDVYTIAGSSTGGQGSAGDGGPGYDAYLSAPMGLAMDSKGDLYIADSANWRVQELFASGGQEWGQSMTAGDIYTVAGHVLGDSGDGSLATQADLGTVTSVAVDSSGDLYLADAGDNQVQEVPAAGGTQWGQTMTADDIYTIAGSTAGTSGRSSNGTASGSALLNDPQGITVDGSGDVYIADTGNNRVAELAKAAGSQWGISMTASDLYDVAGSASGTAGHTGDGDSAYNTALLDAPHGVSLDSAGNLVIADTGSNRVQFVPKSSGTNWDQSMTGGDIYTLAGSSSGTAGNSGNGGTGTSALLDGPAFAGTFSSGKLWIADALNNQIRYVSDSTYDIALEAGDGQTLASAGNGGPAINGELARPGGEIADSHGDLYIADTSNNRVQEIAAYTHTQWGIAMTGGDVYTIAGSATGQSGDAGDSGPATSALLDYPEGLAFDPNGNLLIVDQFNNQVRVLAAGSGSFYGKSMTAADIYTIAGSTAGAAGTGSDGVAATSGLLDHPFGIAVDSAGDIYIADKVNNRIQEIYEGGQSWGQTMTSGDIYTAAGSAAGTSGDSGAGAAATSALLDGPEGVAVDAHGDLYIADTSDEQVQEVPAATGGQWNRSLTKDDIYTIAGSTAGTAGYAGDDGPAASSELHTPVGIATDTAGDLYIADGANNRVREIAAANGAQWDQQMTANDIYTVAGDPGTPSNTGNGGPAFTATIDFAMSNSTDSYGDLYIGDWSSSQLREVVSATPATIDPSPAVTYPSALYPPPGSAINGTSFPGGITISEAGGGQVTFWPQTSGTCATPQVTAGGYCVQAPFAGATLTASGTTSWAFSPAPGSGTYTYSQATGQLTAITDPAGVTLSVTYNSPAPGAATTGTSTAITCPSTATSCQTITAASGRALVMGSDATGQVTSVTDPLGRQWTYTYTGCTTSSPVGDCYLATATDPMGNKTSYTYNTGNANPLLTAGLTTITSPNAQPGGPDAGDDTTIAYNTAGQVTTQTDPMGNKTTFSYTGFDPATGDGVVTTTDPDGNTAVYTYEDGTLAAQDQLTSGSTAVTSQANYIPDTTVPGTASSTCPGNTDGSLLDVASFDGDNNQTTSCYDTDGDVTSSTSPSGGSTASGTETTTTGLTPVTSGNEGDQPNCTADAEATTACTSSSGPAVVAAAGVISPPASAPPEGQTWTLYDTNGNQLYQTTGVYSPSGSYQYSKTTYQLYKGNSITLNSTNITCTYTPPTASLPCATINAAGVVTQLEYDSAGDLELSSTPDGNGGGQLANTSYTYDGDGEQLTEVAPDGNVSGANAGNYTTTTAWNADGEKISVTEGNGSEYTDTPRVTEYGYDGDGNQTTVEDARGYTTTTTFNADNRSTVVKNPDGDSTLTCYDGNGNVAETVPPVGVAANSLTPASCPASYPADYNPATKAPLASDATMTTYNAAGEQTAAYTPAPAGQTGYETTTYTYDGNGNLLTTTAPPATNGGSNQVTVDTYNAAGQLASQTVGSGTSASTISYCYDPDGDKTSVVYGNGNTGGAAACSTSSPWTVTATPQASYQTTNSYDSAGDLVSTVTPANTASSTPTTTATYDAAGQMLTRTDPDGVVTTWTYGTDGNVIGIAYSSGTAHAVTYGYDANGQMTSMTDATGASNFVFNSFGELTSADNGAGQTVGYSYNADGDVTWITYPLPSTATWATTDTVTYGYDNADELTAVTDFNGHQISIGNTADGLPDSVGLGSTGDTITTSYDSIDTPSEIALKNSSSTLQSFSYSDSPAGTILSETDTPSSSDSPADYTYDARGRVTSMTPGTGTVKDYGFDASSNLTTLPTGATGTYNDAGELTSSSLSGTTTDYTYNADGEQLSSTQGTTTESSATWNGAGDLATYDNSAADMTAATYNGNGVRASTTITPSGGSAVTQGYVWNTNPQVPELLMDGTNAYIYDGGSAPAEQINLSAGTINYLVTDSLGSVRGTVNTSGSLSGTTCYDAWGNPETAGGLTATTPFGFAGGYTDPDGLIYLLNRYYNPQTGQFISVDPAIAQTLQPYEYAGGDPVSTIDPSGDLQITSMYSSVWPYLWDGLRFWFSRGETRAIAKTFEEGGSVLDIITDILEGLGLLTDGVSELVAFITDYYGTIIGGAAKTTIDNTGKCLDVKIWVWGTVKPYQYKHPHDWCHPHP